MKLTITVEDMEPFSRGMPRGVSIREGSGDDERVVVIPDPGYVRKLFVGRRIELLRSVYNEDAESISELMRRLERTRKDVTADVNILSEFRILSVEDDDGRSKRVFCPWDEIALEIDFTDGVGQL